MPSTLLSHGVVVKRNLGIIFWASGPELIEQQRGGTGRNTCAGLPVGNGRAVDANHAR